MASELQEPLCCEVIADDNTIAITIMTYHILNGDALAYSFPEAKINGELIVVREALIDGDLSGNNLQDFWRSRAKFLELTDAEYQGNVIRELEKILNAPDNSEFNLWFEYDLFCQVNMWFVISIIGGLAIKKSVYAVYTSYVGTWPGF